MNAENGRSTQRRKERSERRRGGIRCRSRRAARSLRFIAAGVIAAAAGGCSAPAATLELISAARRGLDLAAEAEHRAHAERRESIEARADALDTAFDADVRLVGSGALERPDGSAVELTPEWVISARKGYAAARDALGEKARAVEAVHAANLDNLRTSDEALEMARRLILRRMRLTAPIRAKLEDLHGRWTHE